MPLGSLWDCKYLKKIYFMQQFCKKFHYSSYLRVKSDRDMITFLVCLALLVTAYFTYGRYLERQAGADASAEMPCRRLYDGVDYVPLPRWRAFLIQLLNIAGTGPIFGAVLGACFGPVAFLWITFGGIFMGAMHDYLSGMMLVRNDGLSIPEVVGRYLGEGMRHFMRIFSVLLLVLVGAVFLLSPAQLLANMVPAISCPVWVWLILAYYFVATLLPIDKIIGRIYPLFGVALVAMALGLLGAVIVGDYRLPELTTLHNFQLDPARVPIVPTLFITIACGAISGFHATQSPLMARCVGNERACRSVFYGAMISESIIALIWAAVAMAFFGGAGELSAVQANSRRRLANTGAAPHGPSTPSRTACWASWAACWRCWASWLPPSPRAIRPSARRGSSSPTCYTSNNGANSNDSISAFLSLRWGTGLRRSISTSCGVTSPGPTRRSPRLSSGRLSSSCSGGAATAGWGCCRPSS